MQLKPIGDRVVIQIIKNEEKTEGGLFVPDNAQRAPDRARVLAVNENKMTSEFVDSDDSVPFSEAATPPSVEVGDHIIFNKFSAIEMPDYGDGVALLHEKDILAVIEQPEDSMKMMQKTEDCAYSVEFETL